MHICFATFANAKLLQNHTQFLFCNIWERIIAAKSRAQFVLQRLQAQNCCNIMHNFCFAPFASANLLQNHRHIFVLQRLRAQNCCTMTREFLFCNGSKRKIAIKPRANSVLSRLQAQNCCKITREFCFATFASAHFLQNHARILFCNIFERRKAAKPRVDFVLQP